MKYWLMKSEPEELSIDQLKKEKSTWWTGVRNYQARNFMTKDMKIGDQILFYHSNATPPGIAGLAEVIEEAQPDVLQFQKKSDYYDPKSKPENPTWHCVRVGFVARFKNFISLDELRNHSSLKDLLVLKKGQRLSIQPVSENDFQFIKKLGG